MSTSVQVTFFSGSPGSFIYKITHGKSPTLPRVDTTARTRQDGSPRLRKRTGTGHRATAGDVRRARDFRSSNPPPRPPLPLSARPPELPVGNLGSPRHATTRFIWILHLQVSLCLRVDFSAPGCVQDKVTQNTTQSPLSFTRGFSRVLPECSHSLTHDALLHCHAWTCDILDSPLTSHLANLILSPSSQVRSPGKPSSSRGKRSPMAHCPHHSTYHRNLSTGHFQTARDSHYFKTMC